MRYSNIHTHTTFSDGKNTPEEMIQKAIAFGFCSIGISDHSETAFDSAYCMHHDRYPEYRALISELRKKYEGEISVFCGIEQDSYSPADCGAFDYVIGSVHYIREAGEHFHVDLSLARQMEMIEKHCRGEKLEYARRYYDLVGENAAKGGFEVQGHFDLLNKFGLFDGDNEAYRKIALEALDEVLSKIPYIEMNTGAISRGYPCIYPAPFLLERVLEKGGRMVLNGDSHSADSLDCHFEESVALLKKIGFSSLWQRREEGWTEIPISSKVFKLVTNG